MTGRRVLVTGATGLLGTWLRRCAPAEATVVALVHRTPLAASGEGVVTADLRDAHQVQAAVRAARPDVVIHAAYVIDEASIVTATANLAAAAAAVGAPLVLTSTDAVFSGDGRRRPETDVPDPTHDYGRWKARAEALVTGHDARSAIVRLPLIVSVDPDDHAVAQIRRGALEGGSTTWFDDEIRQPALAADLAPAIWAIVGLVTDDPAGGAGPWHLPGPERLSRLVIAHRAVATLGIDPASVAGGPTPPGLHRPRDLHLLGDRARTALGWSPRPVLVD